MFLHLSKDSERKDQKLQNNSELHCQMATIKVGLIIHLLIDLSGPNFDEVPVVVGEVVEVVVVDVDVEVILVVVFDEVFVPTFAIPVVSVAFADVVVAIVLVEELLVGV